MLSLVFNLNKQRFQRGCSVDKLRAHSAALLWSVEGWHYSQPLFYSADGDVTKRFVHLMSYVRMSSLIHVQSNHNLASPHCRTTPSLPHLPKFNLIQHFYPFRPPPAGNCGLDTYIQYSMNWV